jgi:hypothetical protein
MGTHVKRFLQSGGGVLRIEIFNARTNWTTPNEFFFIITSRYVIFNEKLHLIFLNKYSLVDEYLQLQYLQVVKSTWVMSTHSNILSLFFHSKLQTRSYDKTYSYIIKSKSFQLLQIIRFLTNQILRLVTTFKYS